MNLKLKTCGFALMATLALLAAMTSPAAAQFTSSSSHTIISGSQEGSSEFTAGEGFGGVTCSTVTISATGSSTNDPDGTVAPTASGCKDSFGRTVHIDGSITVTATSNGGATPTGSVHVTSSLTLTVTSGGSTVCTIHIVNNQTDTGITYHNLGGTSGVRVTANSEDVRSITTGSFFSCGVSEGEHTEGVFTGTFVVTGKNTSGSAVSTSVD